MIGGIIMADRINTPFTNEHFADWCQKMVGQPYWYGTCIYKATNSLLSRKSNQYPSSYASSRMSRYKQDIANKAVVSDCIGGCKGYAWTGGGQGVLEAIGTDKSISSSYGSNGCPDKGANSMFSWAKSKGMDWGTIDTLPEIPGVALYKGRSNLPVPLPLRRAVRWPRSFYPSAHTSTAYRKRWTAEGLWRPPSCGSAVPARRCRWKHSAGA